MNKNKVTGYVLLGLGILLIAAAIGMLVVYLLKRRTVPVATEGFYQSSTVTPALEDISSQIHFRFQLNEDKPAQYLNLITSSSDPKPSVSVYNDTTSNGLYKIVDNKDYWDLGKVPTVYFRLQPVTTVEADAKKYYKFVFSAVQTGFTLVDGDKEKEDSDITVFSLKRLDGSERQLNIHNVKLGDYENLASNLEKFYNTAITTASPVPTWFTVLLLPPGNTEVIPGDKGITYSNTDGKLIIVNSPSRTLMIEAGNYCKFSPLPRVRSLAGKVLFDKGGYVQGAMIERDTTYPNTHYYLQSIEETGKTLTYTVDSQSGNGKLEFTTKLLGNQAQIFGIASAMNLNPNIKNPSLLFIVPLIESSKARLDPKLDKLDIVTVGAGGFGITNAERYKLETDAAYLTANSIRVRAMYTYSMSPSVSDTVNTYYIQYPISLVNNNAQIALTMTSSDNAIPYVNMVSAGKDGEIYLYSNGMLLRVGESSTSGYSMGWVDNLADASSLAITPVTISTSVIKYTLTDVVSKASATVAMVSSLPYIIFKANVPDASKAKFSLGGLSDASKTLLSISANIKTALEYLAGVEATPPAEETTTTTTVANTTTTTTAAAGTTTTQPAAGATTTTQPASSASKLSDVDLAKMDEMEKSAALLNERIAELKKDKQVLQTQLARLEGEDLQISDSDYNSKSSNSKLRKVLVGQMDKVADMLEKLKSLSATSAAASAAAHGATDYTQRGGSVKKTDTGVSVSDYEGVLNIFYPQFV